MHADEPARYSATSDSHDLMPLTSLNRMLPSIISSPGCTGSITSTGNVARSCTGTKLFPFSWIENSISFITPFWSRNCAFASGDWNCTMKRLMIHGGLMHLQFIYTLQRRQALLFFQ